MGQFEIINHSGEFFTNGNEFEAVPEFVIFYRQLIDSTGNKEGNKP